MLLMLLGSKPSRVPAELKDTARQKYNNAARERDRLLRPHVRLSESGAFQSQLPRTVSQLHVLSDEVVFERLPKRSGGPKISNPGLIRL